MSNTSNSANIFGNNLVFCQGRFISGPDARSCVATILMISVPSVLWQVEVGAFVASRWNIIFPILTGMLQVATLVLLVLTAFSDPGIIPRQKEYTEQYDPRSKNFRSKAPQRYYDLVLRGHPFKLKYCTTCNLYRPPRCTHCSVCENCIERFDHHCPWIGNCIGRRNYWLFYSFVTCTGGLNMWVLVTAAMELGILTQEYKEDGLTTWDAFVETLQDGPLAVALVIYCVLIVWFTVGLCAYHNYLICTNQTTYEQIKGVYSNGNNPFHRGVMGNCIDALCSKVRPRYFNPHTQQMLWPRLKVETELSMTGGRGQSNAEENNKRLQAGGPQPVGNRI